MDHRSSRVSHQAAACSRFRASRTSSTLAIQSLNALLPNRCGPCARGIRPIQPRASDRNPATARTGYRNWIGSARCYRSLDPENGRTADSGQGELLAFPSTAAVNLRMVVSRSAYALLRSHGARSCSVKILRLGIRPWRAETATAVGVALSLVAVDDDDDGDGETAAETKSGTGSRPIGLQ